MIKVVPAGDTLARGAGEARCRCRRFALSALLRGCSVIDGGGAVVLHAPYKFQLEHLQETPMVSLRAIFPKNLQHRDIQLVGGETVPPSEDGYIPW